VGRVLLALVLGGLIGMERNHTRPRGGLSHPCAGLCLASTLLMMAAVYQGRWMSHTNVIGTITIDPHPHRAGHHDGHWFFLAARA